MKKLDLATSAFLVTLILGVLAVGIWAYAPSTAFAETLLPECDAHCWYNTGTQTCTYSVATTKKGKCDTGKHGCPSTDECDKGNSTSQCNCEAPRS